MAWPLLPIKDVIRYELMDDAVLVGALLIASGGYVEIT